MLIDFFPTPTFSLFSSNRNKKKESSNSNNIITYSPVSIEKIFYLNFKIRCYKSLTYRTFINKIKTILTYTCMFTR